MLNSVVSHCKATIIPTIAALALMAGPASSADQIKTDKVTVQVETLAEGLNHPWAVEVMPDGAYLVTERSGTMRVVQDGNVSEPISGLPEIRTRGQGGLMDVALSPDFAQNRRIFFTATTENENGNGTAAFSATLSQDRKSLQNVQQIFAMNRFTGGNIQYGSRIAFAKDGSLFISLGDRGSRERSQDWQDHAGSIIHINPDGSVPANNPFAQGGKGLPEIWSGGHRNPQGITFDSADNKLYTVEHGARGGDEINVIEPDKNYGWPIISYGVNYSGTKIGEGTAKKGLEQPLYYWDPSIAPGALAIYRGKMFPEWNGHFIVAALKFQLLSHVVRGENGELEEQERMLDGRYGRLRDVIVAPNGALLVVTDQGNGKLLRISRQ